MSLEASLASLEVLGGSSGGHRGSLDVPRGVLEGPLDVLEGVLGRSQGVLGGAWEVPKTDDVFSERLGRVLGGSWGGFGPLGWSSARSWEVQMLLFH